MHEIKVLCIVCKKAIKEEESSLYIGKDIITKQPLRRHTKCDPNGDNTPLKTRSTWVINPKTRVKESDKIYDRNKQKAKLRKEQKDL